MAETTFNVGIYVRLSNDDERDGESVSIENQKLMLQKYVKERGWNEISVYCDDGYSGTTFDRPAVKRLIEDAKNKIINVILVKDLSRFGRNYIEFAQYTDYLFPSIGCRFIALNNGVDTMEENNSNEVMSFLNLFNEFYIRDTSKKVKSVKKACAENGKYLGTYAPYGYKKDPYNKHHLLIDEDYAPYVRRMFHLRVQGLAFRTIAIMLNEEGILPPGVLYYHKKGMADPRKVNHKWAETTVKSIIRNEVYIGNMVQGKTGTFSYKSRKLITKPEKEWIKVENTHDPIIGKELWNITQELDRKKRRKRLTSQGITSIFTGLVYCADCGFKMRYHTENGKHKDGSDYCYTSFICGNYARSGKSACSTHSIYENVLIQLVTAEIREKAQYVEYDEKQIIDSIMRLKDKEITSQIYSYEQELRVQCTRKRELENLMQNLYEDKVQGTISEAVFKTLIQKYEKERINKANAIPALQEKIRSGKQNNNDATVWVNIIKRYTELEKLDTSILYELLDRIEVGEAQKVDGKRICDIKVCYRYV